jgi:hypothetical protein
MNGYDRPGCKSGRALHSVLSAMVLGLIICVFVSCAQPGVQPMIESRPDNTSSHATVSAKVSENKTTAPAKFDPGGQPDRSFVKISDKIGSRDPNSANCEYLITVQNLHRTWSLKNVAVDINGTIYLIADMIGPGQTVEFYRASLPRPLTSYHVLYQWEAPQ